MAAIIRLVTDITRTINNVVIKQLLEFGKRVHTTQQNKIKWNSLAADYKTFSEGFSHYKSAIDSALSADEFLSNVDKTELRRLLTNLNNISNNAKSSLPGFQLHAGEVSSKPKHDSAGLHKRNNYSGLGAMCATMRRMPGFISEKEPPVIRAYRDENKIKYLYECLEKADANLKEGMKLIEEKFGIFKVYFKDYHRGNHINLDYKNGEQEGASHEAKLKHSLLNPSNVGSSTNCLCITRTICFKGQRGVGKTITLKDICTQREVRKVFRDGIHFMTLGENADDETVKKEICRCLKNAGFGSIGLQMKDEESMEEIALKVSKIFQQRRLLLVIDDWYPVHVKYLEHVKSMLCASKNGVLLVASRYKQISSRCDEVLSFEGTRISRREI